MPDVRRPDQASLWSLAADARTNHGHARWSLPVYAAILKELKENGCVSILDTGCGTGEGCGFAQPLGFEMTGADPARSMIEVASRSTEVIKFHIAPSETLPFADQSFDAVLAVNSFHFSPRMPAAAREFARVVRPDGIVAINSLGPRECFQSESVFRALLGFVPLQLKSDERFVDPFRAASPGVVEMMLSDAGLAVYKDDYVSLDSIYDDEAQFLTSVETVALFVSVSQIAGIGPVRASLLELADRFTRPDGSIYFANTARIVFAKKP